MPSLPSASRLTSFLRLALLWNGVGLVLVLHFYLLHLARGLPFGWELAFNYWLGGGVYWLALTPLVTALARRFPVEGDRWGRRLLIHLAFVEITGLLLVVCHIAIAKLLQIEVMGASLRFFQAIPILFLNNAFFHHLIYAAVLAVVSARHYHRQALDFHRQFQERDLRAAHLETQLAQAHLHALRMQLNPHFLFNTLHAISTLVTRSPKAARSMIVHLSALLRSVLDRAAENESMLDEELDFLKHYLHIEQIRFEDRLTVAFDVDPELRDALVPSLILQPLVENAIKHGIAPFDRGGRIEVTAVRRGDELRLCVYDDGPGLGAPDVETRAGIGLKNTRARLHKLYGDAAHLDLTNCPDGGLEAVITLPYHLHPVADAPVWNPSA